MTLEDKIEKILKAQNFATSLNWTGEPLSKYWKARIGILDTATRVDKLIENASEGEALTSPSEYVRGCWRYFNGNS